MRIAHIEDQAWKYIRQAQYQECLNYLDSPSIATSNSYPLLRAHCFQGLKRFTEALSFYKQVPKWRRNCSVLHSIAGCYEEMGAFDQAEKLYLSIPIPPSSYRYLGVKLGLARCCEGQGNYDEALKIYQSIPNALNKRTLALCIVNCFSEMGLPDYALSVLDKHPKWKEDSAVLIAYAKCYAAQDDYAAMNLCLEQAVTRQPEDEQVYYHYISGLFLQEQMSAQEKLTAALQKWPQCAGFYLLKARQEESENIWMAQVTLSSALEQFPSHEEVYLHLMRLYLQCDDQESFDALLEKSHARFSGYEMFFKRVEALKALPRIMLFEPYQMKTTHCQPVKKVALPEKTKQEFALINQLPGSHFLHGSAACHLLSQAEERKQTDTDFLSVMRSHLTTPAAIGFHASRLVPSLYTLFREEGHIDSYKIEDKERALHAYVALRDFSIAGIFIDKDGSVFDRSGFGIADLQKKILRLRGNPQHRFDEEPMRLLRAIKYILLGFTPTPRLEAGMRAWQPSSTLTKHSEHINALLRKYFHVLDEKQLVEKLVEYGLVEKLFGLETTGEKDKLIGRLKVKIAFIKANGVYGMFNPTNKRGLLPSPPQSERLRYAAH